MNRDMYATLQQLLDGQLAEEETHAVHQLITDNAAWQKAWDDMLQMDSMLQSDTLMMEPSMRFTQNVMDDIDKAVVARPASAYISNRFFRSIMIVLGGGLAALLVYLISQVQFDANGGSNFKLPDFQAPAISWSFVTDPQTLLFMGMLNIIGLLLLADKVLSQRRKQHQ